MAYDTCVGETGHKLYIKIAAKYSRAFASYNKSELFMLRYIQRQDLWAAVIELNEKIIQQTVLEDDPCSSAQEETTPVLEDNPLVFRDRNKLLNRLPYSDSWCDIGGGPQTPRVWGGTLLSSKILVTRDELLTLLREKLGMRATQENSFRLATTLQWEFFGSYRVHVRESKSYRKFVGFDKNSPGRKDFVRPQGLSNGETCYLCQVCEYICTTYMHC